jgi:hypothetical protein
MRACAPVPANCPLSFHAKLTDFMTLPSVANTAISHLPGRIPKNILIVI